MAFSKSKAVHAMLALALAGGSVGCTERARNAWFRTGGVVEPSAEEITVATTDFDKALTTLGPYGGAYTYAMVGMEKVRRDCATYFDALALLRREAHTTRDLFAIGGGSTAAVLGIVDASAKAIALAAAGFAATDLSINSLQNNILFVPVAEELKRLTSEAMHSFEIDPATLTVLADLKSSESSPGLGDKVVAQKLVGIYAGFCSPSSIETYVKQALAQSNVTVTASGVDGAGQSSIRTALTALGLSPLDDDRAAAVAAFLRGGYLDDKRRADFEKSFPDLPKRAVDGRALTDAGRRAADQFEAAIRADPAFRRKVEAAAAQPAAAALADKPADERSQVPSGTSTANAMNLKTTPKVTTRDPSR